MLAEHVKDLEKIMEGLFSSSLALDFESFKTNYEVLNAKYEKISSLRIPEKQGETLNPKEICKTTGFKLKTDVENFRTEQVDALQEFCDGSGINMSDLRDEEYWQRVIEAETGSLETSVGERQPETSITKQETSYGRYLSDFLVSKQAKAQTECPTIPARNDEDFSDPLITQSVTMLPADNQSRACKSSFASRFAIIN